MLVVTLTEVRNGPAADALESVALAARAANRPLQRGHLCAPNSRRMAVGIMTWNLGEIVTVCMIFLQNRTKAALDPAGRRRAIRFTPPAATQNARPRVIIYRKKAILMLPAREFLSGILERLKSEQA